METGICEITANYVQLLFSGCSLWNYDGGDRISVVCDPVIEHDRIYRGIPVRADHFFKYRSLLTDDCDYSPVDEQPAELLQPDILE